jgi:SAM-dependent methyltransferase
LAHPEEFLMDYWDDLSAKYTRLMMPRFQPMYDVIADMATSAESVLCIGDGPGEPSLTLSPKSRLVVSDGSAEMLKIAKDRFLERNASAEFTVATDLAPFKGEVFDAVVSSLCLMFIPNLDPFIGQIADLLAPNGLLITSHWSHPSKVPFLRILRTATGNITNEPLSPDEMAQQGPFSLCNDARYIQALENADMQLVKQIKVVLPMHFSSLDDIASYYLEKPNYLEYKAVLGDLIRAHFNDSGEDVDLDHGFSLASECVITVANKKMH